MEDEISMGLESINEYVKWIGKQIQGHIEDFTISINKWKRKEIILCEHDTFREKGIIYIVDTHDMNFRKIALRLPHYPALPQPE